MARDQQNPFSRTGVSPDARIRLPSWKNSCRLLSYLTPDFATKRRWLEYVFYHELRRKEDMELDLMGVEDCWFMISPSSVMGHEVLLYGLYEKYVATAFLAALNEGDVVLDIGANLGQYSLLASRKVGPTGLVIGVEPVPHVFERYQAHLARNGCTNVRAVHTALGAQPGVVRMNVIRDDNDGQHHIASSEEPPGNAIEVPVTTVDVLLDRYADQRPVAVVKIDVEGWETPVFTGASKLFEQQRKPIIFFESISEHAQRYGFDVADLHGMLQRRGYQLQALREVKWIGPVWSDVLPGEPHPPNLRAVEGAKHVSRHG